MEISTIIIGFVSLVIGLGIFILGWISANKISQTKMHNAETYARKITQDAEREAENKKKSALLEAKDEWYRERTKFENYFKISKVQYSTKINFPWNEDKVELRIDKPKSIQGTGGLNFNFEFIYENIDSFIGKLDEADRVYQKFNEILKKLNVGKK